MLQLLNKSLSIVAAMPLLLAPLLWASPAFSQDCPYGYVVTSDADLQAYSDQYLSCTEIRGDLRIVDTSTVTNVDVFVNLERVLGRLTIENNIALSNVDGFENLTQLGEREPTEIDQSSYLSIASNPALTNLDGLAKLAKVQGAVVLSNNVSLEDITGLRSLSSIGGALMVSYLPITALPFQNLTHVGGGVDILDLDDLPNLVGFPRANALGDTTPNTWSASINILGNELLRDLDGLQWVESVGGDIIINGNPNLEALFGLQNISDTSLEKTALSISSNELLADITALRGLTKLNRIAISSNPSLSKLHGLENVIKVDDYPYDAIYIQQNYALQDCSALSVLFGWPDQYLPLDSVAGEVTVGNNGSGCNSVQEIIDSISGPSKPVITNTDVIYPEVVMDFDAATTADELYPILNYRAECSGAEIAASEAIAVTIEDSAGPVTRVLEIAGYSAQQLTSVIEVDVNISHERPEHLKITITSPSGAVSVLADRNLPTSENVVGTFPTSLVPLESMNQLGLGDLNGDWVLSVEDVNDIGTYGGVLNSWAIRVKEVVTASGSPNTLTLSGFTNGTSYECTVAPVTALGTFPFSSPVSIRFPTEPAAPLVTNYEVTDEAIELYLALPDDGGASITRYTATCTDGTNTYTGTSTSSPVIVSGLTNGVAYTCTVTATNSANLTSAPSATTAPIIPEELIPGLPIWLLYQATQ